MRQAISELTNNGYLYKEKGKGTFVAKSKSKVDIKNYTGFTDSILDSHDPSQHNITSLRAVNMNGAPFLKDIFGVQGPSVNAEFAEIKYITSENNNVLSYNTSSYLACSRTVEDIKEKKPSYDILKGNTR